MWQITLMTAIFISIILPLVYFNIGKKDAGKFKTALKANIFSFFALLIVVTGVLLTGGVAKATGSDAVILAAESSATGLGLIAAALAVGISGIGAGIGVASSAAAAIAALSENEGIMGKAIIFVALAEGIALYGLVIAFMILGRV